MLDLTSNISRPVSVTEKNAPAEKDLTPPKLKPPEVTNIELLNLVNQMNKASDAPIDDVSERIKSYANKEVYPRNIRNEVFSKEEEVAKMKDSINQPLVDPLKVKYYHIDKLVTQLINVNIEQNDSKARRFQMIKQLEKDKERLDFLKRTGGGSGSGRLLAEGFLTESQQKYRALLYQIKALDESLESLQRQYDDTKEKLQASQKEFLELRKAPEVEGTTSSVPPERIFSPAALMKRDTWSPATLQEVTGKGKVWR